jgi:hypothetical protein
MAHDPRLTGNTCFCTVCGEYFKSDRAFTRHRVGDPDTRRCLTERELIKKGFGRDQKGRWLESPKVPALAK